MNFRLLIVTSSFCCVFSSAVYAQGLFGATSGAKGESSWSGSSNDTTPGLFGGKSIFGSTSSDGGSKPLGMAGSQSSEGTGLFGLGRPSWLPARDPNAPSMFEQMGEQSKSFFQRTGSSLTDWRVKTTNNIRNANNNIRASTSETWERITNGLPRLNANTSDSEVQSPRPPLGSNWFGSKND